MKILLVDYDNTLFNTNECVKASAKELWGIEADSEEIRKIKREGKSAVYSLAYTKYSHLAKPNLKMINYIKDRIKEGDLVFVLTARHCSVRPYADFSLLSHGVIVSGIICRNDEEMRLKDEEWKAKIISLFKGEIEVYDDKEENLIYFSKLFKNIKYFLVKEDEIIPYNI
ncbi:hypothetical protein [Sulfurisphaera ohwakuensis]|uniref:Uncharacterized protein n=1 Tax=Sulfurisphaera ohwakuensis TaxID=69656 RepID=A0A650CI44_SULOH|nr:hypothetical protein [Sulfurisphaera ohwakuensis]MBB5253801.1 hypothetical protein [Sulfurisphaera ohwakuensis]QGR17524.1 hypothetical protein D1869_10240 [Sulfurisphaera ohwakuensis]